MAKASQGQNTVDADFAAHVTGANSVGIPIGAYHFFQLGEPAAPQVEHFLKTIKGKSLQLPPALDLEGSPSDADFKAAAEWMESVAQRTGCQPLLYIDLSNYRAMKAQNVLSSRQPVWLAAYTRTLPAAGLPDDLWFWQHSYTQTVSGIDGHTDTDWFFGHPSDLASIACSPRATSE